MKTVRYNFERELEKASSNNSEWLKISFRAILESDKIFTQKCDYIGHSILSLDDKIKSIDEEIISLKELKQALKQANETVLCIGAEVFNEYGVDKLEGLSISSITTTKPKYSHKQELVIKDEQALINLGYFKILLDSDRVLDDFNSASVRERLQEYCDVIITPVTTPAKLRVNQKRVASKTTTTNSIQSKSLNSEENYQTSTVAVNSSEYEPVEEILEFVANGDCAIDTDNSCGCPSSVNNHSDCLFESDNLKELLVGINKPTELLLSTDGGSDDTVIPRRDKQAEPLTKTLLSTNDSKDTLPLNTHLKKQEAA